MQSEPQLFDIDQALQEGLQRHREGQISAAESLYQRVLQKNPSNPDALHFLGVISYQLGKFEGSIQLISRALSIRPENAEALCNRGLALQKLGRYEEALKDCEMALSIKPDYAEALSNRGNALKQLKCYDEALNSYDRALAIKSDYAEALYNRGNALQVLKRYDQALASYDRALSIWPEYAEALTNRGNVLKDQGRLEDAVASYEKAISIRPDLAEAHLNQSLCLLAMGDYERGWVKYERRWECSVSEKRTFRQPLWLGKEDLAGKTILLHSEQGLGDTIQFVRYVPLVAERGASVVLEVPKVLAPLMSGLAGANRVVSRGDPLPETDYQTPLLSLPLAFKTTLRTIPSATPYLSINTGRASVWRKKLAKNGEMLVGLSWRGDPNYKRNQERSIPLANFRPMFSISGIQFVSLQKELTSDERLLTERMSNFLHLGADFETTAELVASLDLVISVDSAWAQLTGAIGKPIWVLLPFIPHWCWMLSRSDSPWHSTGRLFRQQENGDWRDVIRKVVHELSNGFGEERSGVAPGN